MKIQFVPYYPHTTPQWMMLLFSSCFTHIEEIKACLCLFNRNRNICTIFPLRKENRRHTGDLWMCGKEFRNRNRHTNPLPNSLSEAFWNNHFHPEKPSGDTPCWKYQQNQTPDLRLSPQTQTQSGKNPVRSQTCKY
ncbi:hypothetical protein DMNBHIDG_01196 [Candidatus Methanoperedenaceae archaeon GB37]|nr:hypothetical protein DMNBHIDG_01196 [Candidatus Methanoperedenaceae archaeon GB37]